MNLQSRVLNLNLKSRILNLEFRRIGSRSAGHLTALAVSTLTVLALAMDVYARVGGGQSYGGGGGHGGGGGGGAGALVYLLVRFLLWLTIEHPVIGIPVDIIVIILIILWFARSAKKTITSSTSPVLGIGLQTGPGRGSQPSAQQAFNQLRRFDP